MKRLARNATIGAASAALLAGCGFNPYELPLPGGADTGDNPYTITAEFRDVLDLVPQSGVRVNDLAVGKVTEIELDGWTAKVTLEINNDVDLPDNAVATIRQTSLLGEKFVSLDRPATGGVGELGDGDHLPLAQTGRNPEIEEVFSAASLLLNGGGLERTNTIVRELNATLEGNEPEIKELLNTTEQFLGQLDDNKDALLTSLEQVNRLAIATDQQTDQIVGALDTLPGALDVLNDQRDDLVELLESLNDLGDVATGVIRESKANTVADLKALTPILTNLATASDDLAYDFKALLSYPFTDGMVGGTFAKASGRCENPAAEDANEGWCVGDFTNLSIRLELGLSQLVSLLGGQNPLEGADSVAAAEAVGMPEVGADPVLSQVEQLTRTLNDIPGFGGLLQPQTQNGEDGSGSGSGSVDGATGGQRSQPCTLFIFCRPSPGTASDDLTSVVVDSVEGSA